MLHTLTQGLFLYTSSSPQLTHILKSGNIFYPRFLCIWLHSSFPPSWLVCWFLLLKKYPHNMMLTLPCFTAEIVLALWWIVLGFRQAWSPAITPKHSISVLKDQSISFLMVWKSSKLQRGCYFLSPKSHLPDIEKIWEYEKEKKLCRGKWWMRKGRDKSWDPAFQTC